MSREHTTCSSGIPYLIVCPENTPPALVFHSFPANTPSYFKLQITGMMEENEKVEPIAKLEGQEFCLDLEELERLHDESEEEVAKV